MESQEQEHMIKMADMLECLIQKAVDSKWKISRGGQTILLLQEGLKRLPGMYGIASVEADRVVDYIVYQVYRNRGMIESGRWSLNWLFTENAMAKFKHQFFSVDGKSGMNFYIDQWLDDAGLSRGKLTSMIAKKKPNPLRNLVYVHSEEPVKLRFYNTPEGFTLCQVSTTGWSPLSQACQGCNSWIECGKETAKKYPELMRYRKETYGKQKK